MPGAVARAWHAAPAAAQSRRVRFPRACSVAAVPVDRAGPFGGVRAGAVAACGVVARRLDRPAAGQRRGGVAASSVAGAGAAGSGSAARQPGVAAEGGVARISGDRHDPHPVDLGAACGLPVAGPLPGAPHARPAPWLVARGRGLLHGALHGARAGGDTRCTGDAAGLADLPGGGARQAVAGGQFAGVGGDPRAPLASARAVSDRLAAVVPVDGRADRRLCRPAPHRHRRPDRTAHRTKPLALGAAAPADRQADVRDGGHGGRGVGRDGTGGGGEVSPRQSGGAGAQSPHRAAGGGGDGVGWALPDDGDGVGHAGCGLWLGL